VVAVRLLASVRLVASGLGGCGRAHRV